MGNIKRVDLHEYSWSDERGWGLNPLKAAGLSMDGFGELHVVSMVPGAIRGNHYHSNATEWLLVCGGPAKIAWRSPEDNSICEETICENKPVLFEIPPRIEHAVLNLSSNDIYLVSFSDSAEPDVVRCAPLFH